jgi:hypothetical protein
MGWKQVSDNNNGDNSTTLAFQKGGDVVYIRIETLGTNNIVTIHGIKVKGPG